MAAGCSVKKFDSVCVYLSGQGSVARKQEKACKSRLKKSLASVVVTNADLAEEEAKAIIILFCSLLDERQRRLYAGLESLKPGHGGDTCIASLLGMDPHTSVHFSLIFPAYNSTSLN